MAVKKSGLGRGFDAIFADNSLEDLSVNSGAVKVKLIEENSRNNQKEEPTTREILR